jgi:hypothetical protein
MPCNHTKVVPRTADLGEKVMGQFRTTGSRLWFECAICGETKGFEHMTALTAKEYNSRNMPLPTTCAPRRPGTNLATG